MIDSIVLQDRLCDICRKDETLLQPRLVGIMEKGLWVGEYSPEKARAARAIRGEWEQEITCPCFVFSADCDEVVICEKHMRELLEKQTIDGISVKSLT